MPRRTWSRGRAPKLITEACAGPVALRMYLTHNDYVLIDGDQYEISLVANGNILNQWIVIGRQAAQRRFEELRPEMAVLVARLALGR